MEICNKCKSTFNVTDKDKVFYDKISPILNGKKFQIPAPTLCPDCRKQRRLSFRSDSMLYERKSSFSQKSMLSQYKPNTNFPVYNYDEWWSDNWDPFDYGQDFDFNKPLFTQFQTLRNKVPRLALYIDNLCENSKYCNQISQCKNCYLAISGSNSEDCYYTYRLVDCRNCIDCLMITNSELCYQCIETFSSYDCHFCKQISNCSNCSFLSDCQSCDHCLFSFGLRGKSYYIFNKEYTKNEFQEKIKQFDFSSYSKQQEYLDEFIKYTKKFPHKFAQLKKTENVTGDNIESAKNCFNVFDGTNLEDVSYAQFADSTKDSMDVNYCCDYTTLHYEVCTSGINAYNIIFSIDTWPNVSNLLYCDSCSNSTDNCFACIGLRHKQYCILNKQYSKQEYEELVPKIIEHMQLTPLSPPYSRGEASEASRGVNLSEWGEFFDPSLSPFGYNETVAQEYFPLTKKQALEQGFNWSDYEAPFPKVEKIIKAEDIDGKDQKFLIPENNNILNYAIECEITHKPFRIIKQELDFYRKHNLPLPKRHPDQRHKDRLSLRNPRKLWNRTCNKCNIPIQTSYSPDRPETVYCEKCYLETVY